jgi:plasmid segregation protein ParM
MKNLILGMDAGNFEVKIAGPQGAISFKSNVAHMVELKVSETHGDDDMIYEIDGVKGLAGTIALRESRFGSSMLGKSKAHEDTKIRVLLGIFRYIEKFKLNVDTVSLVTGQPVDGHDDEKKDAIKKMLKGTHHVVVNNKEMTIIVKEVAVAPEGTGGFWGSNQEHANCFILDCGSGTVNAVCIKEFLHINSMSGTFNFGTESKGMTLEQVAYGAIRESTALGWEKESVVLVCGGSAGKIITPILKHYENAQILIPTLVLEKGMAQMLEPKFANAVGFYNIARGTF